MNLKDVADYLDNTKDYTQTQILPNKDMKYDSGKTLANLPFEDFPNALLAIAEIGTYGAKKYERHSWKTVKDAKQRYSDAMMRHYLEYSKGIENDPESGLPHIAHFGWGVLALLELYLLEIKND